MTSQMNEIRFDRGKIRTLDEGNRKLFCAADTTELLGYADPQEAVRDYCHWDTKRRVTIKDKEVRVTFVPWNDVKALIRNSKQDNKQEIEDKLFRLAFTTQKAEKKLVAKEKNNVSVEILDSNIFGDIRFVTIGDKKWYAGKDVAIALGYTNTRNALSKHCKNIEKYPIETNGGKQTLSFIDYDDVCRLVMSSKLKTAEKFKTWLIEKSYGKDYGNKQTYNRHRDLMTFNSPQFGKVRTLEIDGAPWFVGKDVACALGYKNSKKAIIDHVDDDDKREYDMGNETLPIQGALNTEHNPIIINESGLYSLILSSKLPTAKAFKRWVTHEVIPSIRKTGGYMTDVLVQKVQADPDELQKFVSAFIKEKDRADALEQKFAEAQPKIDGYNRFLNNDGCTTIRVTAKELDVPEKQFTKLLVDKKVLFRTRDGYLLPYANKKNDGMFMVRDFISSSGELSHQTLFTTKGKLYANRIVRENAVAWR